VTCVVALNTIFTEFENLLFVVSDSGKCSNGVSCFVIQDAF
jgi:hypothetical protein